MTNNNNKTLTKITTEEIIVLRDVKKAGIIPVSYGEEIIYVGQNWFKNTGTGKCYHMVYSSEEGLMVDQTRQSRVSQNKTTHPNKPKAKSITRIDIICIDCGITRNIATQDRFQVKRCVVCQYKYKLRRRNETRR